MAAGSPAQPTPQHPLGGQQASDVPAWQPSQPAGSVTLPPTSSAHVSAGAATPPRREPNVPVGTPVSQAWPNIHSAIPIGIDLSAGRSGHSRGYEGVPITQARGRWAVDLCRCWQSPFCLMPLCTVCTPCVPLARAAGRSGVGSFTRVLVTSGILVLLLGMWPTPPEREVYMVDTSGVPIGQSDTAIGIAPDGSGSPLSGMGQLRIIEGEGAAPVNGTGGGTAFVNGTAGGGGATAGSLEGGAEASGRSNSSSYGSGYSSGYLSGYSNGDGAGYELAVVVENDSWFLNLSRVALTAICAALFALHYVIRRRLIAKYEIVENPLASCALVACCPCCVVGQQAMHVGARAAAGCGRRACASLRPFRAGACATPVQKNV